MQGASVRGGVWESRVIGGVRRLERRRTGRGGRGAPLDGDW